MICSEDFGFGGYGMYGRVGVGGVGVGWGGGVRGTVYRYVCTVCCGCRDGSRCPTYPPTPQMLSVVVPWEMLMWMVVVLMLVTLFRCIVVGGDGAAAGIDVDTMVLV